MSVRGNQQRAHEPIVCFGAMADSQDRGFFGHPRGLSTLFFTEMWERFSYYGMRAFLILYMVAPAAPAASALPTRARRRSTAPIPAACGARRSSAASIADRLLGQYRSVLLGGIIIALGHFTLAFKALPFFYTGLGADRHRHRAAETERQHARRIAVRRGRYAARRRASRSSTWASTSARCLGPLVAGYLAQRVDWHIGFACAGVGMALGVVQYVLGRKRLRRRRSTRLAQKPQRRRGRDSAAHAPPVDGGFTSDEWKRMGAIVIFFLVAVLFWGAYEQAGSTLNLFADRYTRLEVFGFSFPSSWFQSVQPIFVILLAPVFAWIWMRLGQHEPSVPAKFAHRPAVHGPGVSRAGAGRGDGAERRRRPRQPVVADRVVRHLGARRAVPQPGRPQRGDQARAAAHRRADDGRVVPVERLRQQAGRLGGRLLQHDAAATRCSAM